MANNIGIKVSATTDTTQVEQALNSLGQKIGQANRVKFEPIGKDAVKDVEKMNRAVDQLVKTQKGLRQRLKSTGQESTPFSEWNWEKMYPHAASRGVAMQGAFQRVTGQGFGPALPGAPTGAAPSRGGGFGGMVGGVAQAGLRAAGPVGGVAAEAVGTGMSAGFGAGLMGLVGGVIALGVGKLVSSVMEKIDQAEQNNVDYDRLKRVVGDVGVSFGVLKTVVTSSADNLKITYSEAGKLGTQFAKLANLSGDQVKSLGDELDTGVGLSRSFGLDPSQGMGVMGQMRGLGVTRDAQDSKRFALLIGETIGKSGAFTKADEVMDAIAGYASSQTRGGANAANVAGYAGMFSSMVGSGMSGFDVAGSAGMLGRINSSLSAGGAKGEASQFFTGSIGAANGLNPYQMQSWRENGAFGTMDQSFGEGSVYARYKGKAGPGGSTTLLQATLDKLRKQYGEGSDELANATANHLGIGQNQAMGLLSLKPNQMGEMAGYAGDLTKMSGRGIGNLTNALYGDSGKRQALADDFLGRRGSDAISGEDSAALKKAQQGGNDDELKRVLASMAVKYDQERTTGSDIRDSKNALDNIKVAMADRLIPLTQGIRDATMLMAGNGKMSPMQVQQKILDMESQDRTTGIKRRFGALTDPLDERAEHLRNKERSLDPVNLQYAYRGKPEIIEEKMKERAEVQAELIEVEKKLAALTKDKNDALKAENDEAAKRLRELKDGYAKAPDAAGGGGGGGGSAGDFSRMDRGGGGGDAGPRKGFDPLQNVQPTASSLNDISDPEQRKNAKAYLDGLAKMEGADYNTKFGGGKIDDLSQHPGKTWGRTIDGPSSATGRYQFIKGTWDGVQKRLGLPDFGPESQDKAAIQLMKDRGAWGDILKGDFHAATKKLGSEWASLPSSRSGQGHKTWAQHDAILANARKAYDEGTPMPGAEAGYKPGAITSMPLPPLSGEMQMKVDLSADAKRMLNVQAPVSTRIGAPKTAGDFAREDRR